MKVLIVDDSDYARRRIGKVLREGGHEIVEAENGEQALGLVEETKPHAVTVDLLMPGMDGIELIGRLRARWPELPIIALSADVQQATRQEVMAAGASGFVAKTALDEILPALMAATSREKIPPVMSASQKDAFTEVMNVAMGQAAEALSVLLARRVLLKVPEVELMTASGLTDFLRNELIQVGISVRQQFSGCLDGTAAMVFSTPHAIHLVRSLLDIQLELSRLSAAEQSALTEMGNIVLNAAIAVLADQCDERIRVSLPDIAINRNGIATARELINSVAGADNAIVLVSRLTIGETEMISYLILLLPEADVKRLLARIAP